MRESTLFARVAFAVCSGKRLMNEPLSLRSISRPLPASAPVNDPPSARVRGQSISLPFGEWGSLFPGIGTNPKCLIVHIIRLKVNHIKCQE